MSTTHATRRTLRVAVSAGVLAVHVLAVLLTAGCEIPGPLAEGRFRALSYNVAGLPDFLSKSSPAVNTPQISPLLNTYDLVCVQEDFAYHAALASQTNHPYWTTPQPPGYLVMNDGLNRFSRIPLDDFQRQRWHASHGVFGSGSDSLSAKGFSFARLRIGPALSIDVYNHHADAGGDPGDVAARAEQYEQLAGFIEVFSRGRAVIVCGDTNLDGHDPDDEPTLQAFLTRTGLTDVARLLGAGIEKIDRFLFRSGDHVHVVPTSWRIASEFVTPAGQPLSDHEAVHVDFEWTVPR